MEPDSLVFLVKDSPDTPTLLFRFLTKKEYAAVWVFVIVHLFLPLHMAVGVGLMVASGIFVMQYATRSPIKLMMTGEDYRAVTRPVSDTKKLAQLGRKMLTIVRLQGYLFFGSAAQVLEVSMSCAGLAHDSVPGRARAADPPPKYT